MTDLTPEERREAERQSWQFKVIAATRGNQTLFGACLLSIIGRVASNPPWVGMTAVITPAGDLLANVQSRQNHAAGFHPVPCSLGPISVFVDQCRRVADETKLDDAQRIAFFDEVRKWITHDFRAINDPDYLV
jgi:hypothetical protein